jgi:hypothetical protein
MSAQACFYFRKGHKFVVRTKSRIVAQKDCEAFVYRKPKQSYRCVMFSAAEMYQCYGSKHVPKQKVVGFKVLTAATEKCTVFWDVAPCKLMVLLPSSGQRER